MDLATLEERVTVERKSPVVDKQSVEIATSFDADQLANLPGARNMMAIMAATPAVYVTRFDVGGNTAALGVENGAFGTTGEQPADGRGNRYDRRPGHRVYLRLRVLR